jgi:hypothetical protein
LQERIEFDSRGSQNIKVCYETKAKETSMSMERLAKIGRKKNGVEQKEKNWNER